MQFVPFLRAAIKLSTRLSLELWLIFSRWKCPFLYYARKQVMRDDDQFGYSSKWSPHLVYFECTIMRRCCQCSCPSIQCDSLPGPGAAACIGIFPISYSGGGGVESVSRARSSRIFFFLFFHRDAGRTVGRSTFRCSSSSVGIQMETEAGRWRHMSDQMKNWKFKTRVLQLFERQNNNNKSVCFIISWNELFVIVIKGKAINTAVGRRRR